MIQFGMSLVMMFGVLAQGPRIVDQSELAPPGGQEAGAPLLSPSVPQAPREEPAPPPSAPEAMPPVDVAPPSAPLESGVVFEQPRRGKRVAAFWFVD